jgi:uncharacterized phage protein (TIGR01671 family)
MGVNTNMNNRFKFRIWDSELKRYHALPKSVVIDLDGNVVLMTDKGPFPYPVDSNRFIIQQFTGFKDVNKKDIYEGDIFKGDYYKWDAVEFVDGKFVVNLKGARQYDLCELFDDRPTGDYPEVIGNIFENEELLK